jgi:hypothetical protein
MLVNLADWCFRRRRVVVLTWLGALVVSFLLAGALVYTSFSASTEASTPSEVMKNAEPGRSYQLTGKVVKGSVERQDDGLEFAILDRDGTASVPVSYAGVVPDPSSTSLPRGIAFPIPVLAPEELADVRAHYASLVDAHGGKLRSFDRSHYYFGWAYDLATHPRILDTVSSVLGDDVVVYSGHGPETTLGRERRTNPFLTGRYL